MNPERVVARVPLARRVLRRAAVVALPFAFGACTWFTDFKRQPKIDPWEPLSQNDADSLSPPRGQPKFSVPLQGTSAAAYTVSYAPLPAVIDSFSNVPNPVAVDARSLENGRKEYQINCAVCHGAIGDGNGGLKRVNPAYGYAPSLLAVSGMGRSEGYIYGMIRNGRGSMPNYNRIEEPDRWDIVNYVRALQGKTALKPDTMPAGYPGQNGTTVPGPSYTAPTRPAPYLHPTITLTTGSSGVNSATAGGGKEKHP